MSVRPFKFPPLIVALVALFLSFSGCEGCDGNNATPDLPDTLAPDIDTDGNPLEGGTDIGNPNPENENIGDENNGDEDDGDEDSVSPDCVSQIDCDGDGITKGCDKDDLDVDNKNLKPVCVIPPDEDIDGVPNGEGDGYRDISCTGEEIDRHLCDNCPTIPNPDQADADGDGMGDACDAQNNITCPDADGDFICDVDTNGDGFSEDNCVGNYNHGQEDMDGDHKGDPCDDDVDGDGFANATDKCPALANPDQADTDGDGQGDSCDNDADGETPPPPSVVETPAPPSEPAPEYRVVVGPETPLQVYQETVEDIRVSFASMSNAHAVDHRHKDLTLTFCPTLSFDDPQCVGFKFNPATDGDGNLVSAVEGYGWETGTLVNETGNNRSGDITPDRLRYFRLSLLDTERPAVSIPGIKVEAVVGGEWLPLYFNPYLRDSVRPARDLIFGPDDTAVVFTVETGSDLGAGTDDDVRLFFPKQAPLDPQLELYNQSQDLARPHFEIREESISMYLDWPETDDFESSQSGTYSAYFFNGDPIERQFFIEKSGDDHDGDWKIRSYNLNVFKPGDPLFFETESCHVIVGGPFSRIWLEDDSQRLPRHGWQEIPEGPCSPLTNELHNNYPSSPPAPPS